MSTVTVLGQNAFIEQPVEERFEEGTWKRFRTWEGPPALVDDQVFAIQVLLTPDKIDVKRGVPSVIRATFGNIVPGSSPDTPEAVAEDNATWDLIGMDLEKPLATHGYFTDSGCTAQQIELADEAIRKGTARSTDWSAIPVIGTKLQSYVNHRLRGIDTWITFSYIVRKTVVFSRSTNIRLEFGVFPGAPALPGKIITWNEIGVPTRARFQQPYVRIWPVFGAAFANVPLNEWMVKAPAMTWDRKKQIHQITREWWGAEKWSGPPPSGAPYGALYEGGTYSP